jgi:hypothetical protein
MPAPEKSGTDRVILIGAEHMPFLPPPLAGMRTMQKTIGSARKDEDGVSINVDKAFPEYTRLFMNELEAVKVRQSIAADATAFGGAPSPGAAIVVKSLSDLTLSFSAAAVPSGELIGAMPFGPKVNGAWTGVKRYFRIDGGGYLCVSETDMAAINGMVFLFKSVVNTTVANKPAGAAVFIGKHDQRIEEVMWVDGGRLYKVTYAPDQQAGRYGMMKTNPALSALSLALELR